MGATDERIARLERRVDALLATMDIQATRIAALEVENKTLRVENVELKRRLDENSTNSSKPPSTDSPGQRQQRAKPERSGRAPGGQPGHKGKRRELVPADKVTGSTECFPETCRRCGDALARRTDAKPLRHQVIEIPEIEADIHEFRLHRVTCACGATTCGELPNGTPVGIFGPRLLTLIAVLTGSMHVSRRKVQLLLADLLGVEVSLGCISESEELVNDAVAVAVDEARVDALAASVKYVDATTWYQAGDYRSLWVLATKAVTVFYVAANGTRDELAKWLSKVRGILVTDRGTQFGFWAMERRQICWAHLVRKFASYATRQGRARTLGNQLLLWSGFVLHDWHRVRDGTMSRSEFRIAAAPIRVAIERLLEEGTGLPEIGGSCRDIVAHRAALWTFIDRTGVDPTNNHAERELRSLVVWRKLTFGSRSDRGTCFAANIKSVVHTCRKQGRHVFEYLVKSINSKLRNRRGPSLLAAA